MVDRGERVSVAKEKQTEGIETRRTYFWIQEREPRQNEKDRLQMQKNYDKRLRGGTVRRNKHMILDKNRAVIGDVSSRFPRRVCRSSRRCVMFHGNTSEQVPCRTPPTYNKNGSCHLPEAYTTNMPPLDFTFSVFRIPSPNNPAPLFSS